MPGTRLVGEVGGRRVEVRGGSGRGVGGWARAMDFFKTVRPNLNYRYDAMGDKDR